MDAQATAVLVDEVLRATRAPYQNRERLRGDVVSLLRVCQTLQPRSGSFSNGGRTVELFYLYGVLPINYKGAEYNIPVSIYFDPPYPRQPPRCFVTPTAGMVIKTNHPNVDQGGMVDVPYLRSWKERSSLSDLIGFLSSAFSALPPVYSKPGGGASTPAESSAAASGAEQPGVFGAISGLLGMGGAAKPSSAPSAGPPPQRGRSGSMERQHSTQDQSTRRVPSRGPSRAGGDGFPNPRKDSLSAQLAESVRGRWPLVLAPVVDEVNEQIELRAKLQAPDDASTGISGDPDSDQALECLAEELALEELLVCLDELFGAQKLALDDFLREVRDVSRRQFIVRAQRLKSANASAAAAPLPTASERAHPLPPGGTALHATGPGAGLGERGATAGRRL